MSEIKKEKYIRIFEYGNIFFAVDEKIIYRHKILDESEKIVKIPNMTEKIAGVLSDAGRIVYIINLDYFFSLAKNKIKRCLEVKIKNNIFAFPVENLKQRKKIFFEETEDIFIEYENLKIINIKKLLESFKEKPNAVNK